MFEWQFTHDRPNIRLLLFVGDRVVVVDASPDACVATWQRWQSIGMRTTSMRSFDEPCGSWHVVQFSRTGACSHSIGPRISAWQLVHSLVDRAADLQRLDVADRAVRVVARRARHLALAHRHVRDRALGLGDLQAMARRAQLRSAVALTS